MMHERMKSFLKPVVPCLPVVKNPLSIATGAHSAFTLTELLPWQHDALVRQTSAAGLAWTTLLNRCLRSFSMSSRGSPVSCITYRRSTTANRLQEVQSHTFAWNCEDASSKKMRVHTHTYTHSLTHSHTHSLSLSLYLSLSLSLAHTHAHTHTHTHTYCFGFPL